MEQLIEKNAQSPSINGEVVLLLEDHLWCHILVSSTESFSFHLNVVCCPAQIADLDIEGIIQKYVFWLNF